MGAPPPPPDPCVAAARPHPPPPPSAPAADDVAAAPADGDDAAARADDDDAAARAPPHPPHPPPPPPPPPPGLANLGNTCYLNSVVQALYHTPALREAVLAIGADAPPPPHAPPFALDFARELRAVFAQLDNAADHARAVPPLAAAAYGRDGIEFVSPRSLVQLLRHDGRCDFDAEGQQDAQEFLRFLLDKLHDALSAASVAPEAAPAQGPKAEPASKLAPPPPPGPELGPAPAPDAPDAPDAPPSTTSSSTEPNLPGTTSSSTEPNLPGEGASPDAAAGDPPAKPAKRPRPPSASVTAVDASRLQEPPPDVAVAAATAAATAAAPGAPDSKAHPPPLAKKPRVKDAGGGEEERVREAPAAGSDAVRNDQQNGRPQHRQQKLQQEQHDQEQRPQLQLQRQQQHQQQQPQQQQQQQQQQQKRHQEPTQQQGKEYFQPPLAPPSHPGMPPLPRHPAASYQSHVVTELFRGRVETVTRCLQCEHANSRAEHFLDVSLPVEVGRSLSWALATHGKDESMDGSNKYACGTCNTYQEARQCWRLSHIPPLFTVHLKLFAFASGRPLGAKVPAAMPCPFSLRLARWSTADCAQRNLTYRLASIIVHDGSTSSSGHYYAYVKVAGRGWFLFDDSDVSQSSENRIRADLFTSLEARNTAYLLLYECDCGLPALDLPTPRATARTRKVASA